MISKKMKKMLAGSSAIRSMFSEGKRLAALHGVENVYDYSLGNPNVPAPDIVCDAAVRLLTNEDSLYLHGYTSNGGYEDVRDAVAKYINRTHGGQMTREHIVMCVGAAGGLNVIFKTILDPGDEVVVFVPYFGEYRNYVENYNGVLCEVESDPNTFFPDLEQLSGAISNRTKAVIVNSPNNPTGVIYDRNFLNALTDLLRRKRERYGHPIYLISDEPYRELVYDKDEVCWIPELYDDTLVCYSYSKSLSLPGERIGYVAISHTCEGADELAAAAHIATRILGFVNAPTLQQQIVKACLGQPVNVDYYRKNRDLLYSALSSTGYECVYPRGAFYLYMKSPIDDDRAFCERAKSHNLLIVPGSAFGTPGYVRLAYCVDHQMIIRSLPVFSKLMEEIRNSDTER